MLSLNVCIGCLCHVHVVAFSGQIGGDCGCDLCEEVFFLSPLGCRRGKFTDESFQVEILSCFTFRVLCKSPTPPPPPFLHHLTIHPDVVCGLEAFITHTNTYYCYSYGHNHHQKHRYFTCTVSRAVIATRDYIHKCPGNV